MVLWVGARAGQLFEVRVMKLDRLTRKSGGEVIETSGLIRSEL